MRDVNSRRVPTPGLDRHTSRPVIIQSTPVPPTTLCLFFFSFFFFYMDATAPLHIKPCETWLIRLQPSAV
jgi:hypothetical protein